VTRIWSYVCEAVGVFILTRDADGFCLPDAEEDLDFCSGGVTGAW